MSPPLMGGWPAGNCCDGVPAVKRNEPGLLLLNKVGVAYHFEKPCHAVPFAYRAENAFGIAAVDALSRDVIEFSRLITHLNGFEGFIYFIRYGRSQTDLAAPAIDIGRIAAG